jgi:UPF0755 protein
MSRSMRIFAILFILLLIGGGMAGGLFAFGYAQFVKPGPLQVPATVIIAKGAGLKSIADQLHRDGILQFPLVFRLGARLTEADKQLKAGEYVLPRGVTPQGILVLLQSGKTVVRRLTMAEGLTSFEIIKRLNAVEGLIGTAAPSPEGSLLPETYHFSLGDSRQKIADRMSADMRRELNLLWLSRDADLPLKSPDEALVLASIVERETGVASERARVAAVFVNRLRRGMKLQSDPTVVYGITLGKRALGRPLSRADLKNPTPYNTYTIDALPPGPIANPGRSAIEAVLHPTRTKEIYFVADGSGGHAFAKTLTEHNRNVARWRKFQKQKPKSGK